jgi:hypothetical protein
LADQADVTAAAAALQHSTASSTTTTTATTTQPQIPSHHPASLAHGMLPLVQQAIRHAAIVAGTTATHTTSLTTTTNNDTVPPIHRLEGMRQNINYNNNNGNNLPQYPSQSSNYGISMDYDSTSTDFLSWILLLLGIFVLACLILF